MAQYNGWWATPRDEVTACLTGLILRVFAFSLRFSARGGATEFYGMNIQELTDKVHTAANQVSSSIRPGEGGVSQVQELFLTAIWLESTEQKKEARHTLRNAISAAYEIGIFSVPAVECLLIYICRKVFTKDMMACRNLTGREQDVYGLFCACGISK